MHLTKKKLIIDGQLFQTDAKDRGMGRYSVRLIQALLEQKHDYQEIEIILTTHLPVTEKSAGELKEMFAGTQLHFLDLWVTYKHKIEDTFAHNGGELNVYVESQRKRGYDVDYLIPSLFQEPIAAVFPTDARKFLIFYDLIPYLYFRRYQPIMQFENYLKRFAYIFKADIIFCISRTVADDLHTYLGVPRLKLTNIDGAAIRSNKEPLKPLAVVPQKFILMPTSDDLRKNNFRAVLGFEEFRITSGKSDYILVITSTFNKRDREYLQLFSDHLLFTGNLPEEQLEWLYEQCSAVLFVPEYEGLGLPILEAIEFNKSVACSSIGVFKEISDNAFCFCDHQNPTAIAEAIRDAISTKPNKEKYTTIAKRYSWENSAKKVFEAIVNYRDIDVPAKPKIAVFTPPPDGINETGKLVALCHATMSEYFDVDYFIENVPLLKPTRPNYLRYVAPSHGAQTFGVKNYHDYDAVFYNITNGDQSLETIKSALYLPGYMVLHCTSVHDAYRKLVAAKMMPAERLELEEKLNSDLSQKKIWGLNALLNVQLGAIALSVFTQAAVHDFVDSSFVIARAHLPTAVPELTTLKPDGRIIIGLNDVSGGDVAEEIIEAIMRDPHFHNCHVRLFSFDQASAEIIKRVDVYENVTLSHQLSDFEYQTVLSQLHIFVNYDCDNDSAALSTIEAMRYGSAVIVSNTGWYKELPDEAVAKASNSDDVMEQLRGLIDDSAKLLDLGKRAKALVNETYSYDQYVQAHKDVLNNNPASHSINRQLADKIKAGKITSSRRYIKYLSEAA